jgi:histidine ammonia-lyase
MNGHMNAMDYRVQAIRPHAGGGVVARIMRGLIPPGSHTVTNRDVQDYYSLR